MPGKKKKKFESVRICNKLFKGHIHKRNRKRCKKFLLPILLFSTMSRKKK